MLWGCQKQPNSGLRGSSNLKSSRVLPWQLQVLVEFRQEQRPEAQHPEATCLEEVMEVLQQQDEELHDHEDQVEDHLFCLASQAREELMLETLEEEVVEQVQVVVVLEGQAEVQQGLESEAWACSCHDCPRSSRKYQRGSMAAPLLEVLEALLCHQGPSLLRDSRPLRYRGASEHLKGYRSLRTMQDGCE